MNTLDIDAYDRFLQLAESTDWAMLTDEQRQLALQFVSGEAEYAAYATTLYNLQHHLLHEPIEVPDLKPDTALRQALQRKYGKGAGSGGAPPRLLRMMLPIAAVAAMLIVAVGYWGWPDTTTPNTQTADTEMPDHERPAIATAPTEEAPVMAEATRPEKKAYEKEVATRAEAEMAYKDSPQMERLMDDMLSGKHQTGAGAGADEALATTATGPATVAANASEASSPDLPTFSRPVADDWALLQAVY